MDLFENIKHTDEKGNDFWLFSELIKELNIKSTNMIYYALFSNMKSGHFLIFPKDNHFVEFTEMLTTTDGKNKFEKNYKLSFNACCLIFKDLDYKNEEVDLAKSYFNEIKILEKESNKEWSLFDFQQKKESVFNLLGGNMTINDSLGSLKINSGIENHILKQPVSTVFDLKLSAEANDAGFNTKTEKSIDNTTNYKSDIVQPANEPALNDEATKPVIVIQKSFEDYLLHEAKMELAIALKREFATEKGKSIRLLIETMQDLKTPLLSLCRGEGMKFYKAMKLFFNKDIGSYNSIFNYEYSKSKDEKDIQAITKRLNFILEQIN